MPWTFDSAHGTVAHNGTLVYMQGYAGFGVGKNAQAYEVVPSVGPLPRGRWTIGPAHDTDTHGPVVMALTPDKLTLTFGRDGFLIHGDSSEHPGLASTGCIVLPRDVRQQIADSGDSVLYVI